ncbi:solute carrier organic anion transporter family member 5A1-like, partial [Diadema antillarum]|uniref:solute carrier organic anion transporter family member 5A1-like n=1 Tax=Diadema antillarum TaxID=105358 RepID=UPI003A862400
MDEESKMTSEEEIPDLDSRSDTLCGCPPVCNPSWLQRLANPKVFTAHMMVVTSVQMMSFVYLGAVLTTIERNFQLDSSESGSLSIYSDVAGIIFVLPLSYYGQRGHRPKWIATGLMLTSLGTFLCAMPHFLSRPLDPDTFFTSSSRLSNGKTALCDSERPVEMYAQNVTNSVGNFSDLLHDAGKSTGQVWWIIVGQVMVGIGSAAFFPLLSTYIDDSVKKHNLTAYTALLFTAFTIGPSMGFLLGSLTTSKYVDFDRVTPDQIPDISQSDPRWIGAWWLGFIITGVILAVLSLPIFFYPKILPSALEKWRQEREVEKEDRSDETLVKESENALPLRESLQIDSNDNGKGLWTVIKGPLLCLRRLFLNPTNMAIAFYGAAFSSILGIYGSFSVKFIQVQYAVSPATASTTTAIIVGPAMILSQVFSGYVCRRFKLNSKQCALFAVIGTAIGLLLYPVGLFLGCDNISVAGVTEAYDGRSPAFEISVSNACNTECSCDTSTFQPVCGSNGVTYITPCHAGCLNVDLSVNETSSDQFQLYNYTQCQCVRSQRISINQTVPEVDATSGPCPKTCPAYLSMCLLVTALFFLQCATQNPGMYVGLRCVEEDDRSMALGLRTVISKILGFFPAPIYFGAIINSVCLHWQWNEGERGACWIYDNKAFRMAFMLTLMALQGLELIFLLIVFFSIRESLK